MDTNTTSSLSHAPSEQGVVLLVVIAALLPILFLANSAVTMMTARGATVVKSRDRELALVAAESGIDQIIHLAREEKLVSGRPVIAQLQVDLGFVATATHIGGDAEDNDGDGEADELDEQVYEVTSTGHYRDSLRRLLCYVGPLLRVPPITAAINLQDGTASVTLTGGAFRVRGVDTSLDGGRGTADPVPGIKIAAPGDKRTVLTKLGTVEQSRIDGFGGTPSVHEDAQPLDLQGILTELHAAARHVLPGGSCRALPRGTEEWEITYVDGNLDLSGEAKGAGILAVAGDVHVSGALHFDGLVIAGGSVEFSGGGSGTVIRGGLVLGGHLSLRGAVDVLFSSEAAERVRQLALRRRILGWLEVGAN